MNKNLIVTISDNSHINMAKQLFSSLYFNSGWKGDYMLLSYQVPEKKLAWFRKRGILVRNSELLWKSKNISGLQLRQKLKLNIFTDEFKKWTNIIYLDSDIIVTASLDDLVNVKGFGAVPDSGRPLRGQFVDENVLNRKIFHQLYKEYDVKKKSFNSGVLAFNSDNINSQVLDRALQILEKYGKIFRWSDQPLFNLLFYEKWVALPCVYNVQMAFSDQCQFEVCSEKNIGIVLHFPTRQLDRKPWSFFSPYNKLWKENFYKANLINLEDRLQPKKIWSDKEINNSDTRLKNMYRTRSRDSKIKSIFAKIKIILKLFLLKKE